MLAQLNINHGVFMETADPFSQFKANQKVGWGLFAPLEAITIPAASKLVDFAEISSHQTVLDCACGTGVVAITAARKGARVKALDIAPALLEHARANAALAQTEIEFTEGDVEALPYADASFDVVVSQFGHMFAPRPEVSIKEMLRVLKPGGRIAFSTWPKDHFTGLMFNLVGQYVPAPPGVPPSTNWGETTFVRERLAEITKDLSFDRSSILVPSLSPQYNRNVFEKTSAPLIKLVNDFKNDPVKLSSFRSELEKLITRYTKDNVLHQHYLLSRATKI